MLVRINGIQVKKEQSYPKNKVHILCQLDASNIIESGEWMGYLERDGYKFPFVLTQDEFFYGGEPKPYTERTNIHKKTIVVGELFTVFVNAGEGEGEGEGEGDWVVRIESIYKY